MKELYISPALNVICFVPVERLANSEEELKMDLMMDIAVCGAKESGVDVEDEDFGVEIP